MHCTGATVLDLWVPLAMGARVVIASADECKDMARVRSRISQHGVTAFTGVPSALQVSRFADQPSCLSLIPGMSTGSY